ncbi:Sec-independent protein translocase protein TatB [Thiomicrorhabdus indica]|jgi:sec-independent protein translocase protein TatB|uniref:Sec-independent protein translocase protein TatB n=1 Tax=Thiomicrorhabdus indica TaxID=2267253 RepID=UPI00102DE0F6|nr:Sec-independent protein translocase protein TatB [Thiomicrorhabdus indica]
MFDIGFLEIMVILVITLLVIGPERMPEVARKIGSFIGKMRRFVNSVKAEGEVAETINDFKKSIDLEEQKKQISSISDELNKGLSVGLDNVNMDELQRPFAQNKNAETEADESESVASSQFNKAPIQPQIPTQAPTSAPQKPEESTTDTTKPTESVNSVPSQAAKTPAASTEAAQTKETTAKSE